jgi:hypothetical protein
LTNKILCCILDIEKITTMDCETLNTETRNQITAGVDCAFDLAVHASLRPSVFKERCVMKNLFLLIPFILILGCKENPTGSSPLENFKVPQAPVDPRTVEVTAQVSLGFWNGEKICKYELHNNTMSPITQIHFICRDTVVFYLYMFPHFEMYAHSSQSGYLPVQDTVLGLGYDTLYQCTMEDDGTFQPSSFPHY